MEKLIALVGKLLCVLALLVLLGLFLWALLAVGVNVRDIAAALHA